MSETKEENKIDLNNYVPKSEFDKVQAQASDAAKGMESLKSQLLDKDYLDYLEARNAGGRQQQAAPAVTKTDIKNLDMAGLVDLINKHSVAAIESIVGPHIQRINGQLTNVEAVLEAEQVSAKYDDFFDFKDSIEKILQTSQNTLTIEQAYLMAKAAAPNEPEGKGEEKPQRSPRGERPGTIVPLDEDTVKTFKTPEAAALAAANEVLARHGMSGDSI